MSYTAAGSVSTVTPEQARAIAETGEPYSFRESHFGFTDHDGAMYTALRSLALARAPDPLALFIRHWAVGARGRSYLIEGMHFDFLEGRALELALTATDALLLECATRPELISDILEAADLPHGLDAESAADELRDAAATPAPSTPEAAATAFEEYPLDHLSPGGLHAWLRAFAACLRHAHATSQVALFISEL